MAVTENMKCMQDQYHMSLDRQRELMNREFVKQKTDIEASHRVQLERERERERARIERDSQDSVSRVAGSPVLALPSNHTRLTGGVSNRAISQPDYTGTGITEMHAYVLSLNDQAKKVSTVRVVDIERAPNDSEGAITGADSLSSLWSGSGRGEADKYPVPITVEHFSKWTTKEKLISPLRYNNCSKLYCAILCCTVLYCAVLN